MKEITSLAPGRTCLFGDHQDYLGLPVIACAINRNIKLTAVPNDKQVFNLIMNDIDQVTPEFIAQMGYTSEVLEHGEPGGMMDHYSIGIGNIVHIDTKTPFSCTIIGTELKGLITGVSGVPKETIGVLGDLKENALLAIDIIKQNFADFDLNKTEITDLKKYCNYLPDRLIPFFEGAIKNHHYTKLALKEFQKPTLDLKKIGELMNAHHAVLRDLLKITVPRIDAMINAALKAGAYGAKIVGSGGGGSIVVLAEPGNEAPIVDAILAAGAIQAYTVTVDPGVRTIANSKI